jgi:hypothetical protein
MEPDIIRAKYYIEFGQNQQAVSEIHAVHPPLADRGAQVVVASVAITRIKSLNMQTFNGLLAA